MNYDPDDLPPSHEHVMEDLARIHEAHLREATKLYREIGQAQRRRRIRNMVASGILGGSAAMFGSIWFDDGLDHAWFSIQGAIMGFGFALSGYLLGMASWFPRIDTEKRIAELRERQSQIFGEVAGSRPSGPTLGD